MRVRQYPKRFRTRDLKMWYRRIYFSVMEAYTETKSVIGEASLSFDYSSKNPGSQGAQYRDDSLKAFQTIDFVTDVTKTAEQVLDNSESSLFFGLLKSDDINTPIQTEEYLAVQEKLGRAFLGRKLYPVNKYFTWIKR